MTSASHSYSTLKAKPHSKRIRQSLTNAGHSCPHRYLMTGKKDIIAHGLSLKYGNCMFLQQIQKWEQTTYVSRHVDHTRNTESKMRITDIKTKQISSSIRGTIITKFTKI